MTLHLGGDVQPARSHGSTAVQRLGHDRGVRARPIRARTAEGIEHGRRAGRLPGEKAKLSALRQAHLVRDHESGECTVAQLVEAYGVSRATVYRVIQSKRPDSAALESPQ